MVINIQKNKYFKGNTISILLLSFILLIWIVFISNSNSQNVNSNGVVSGNNSTNSTFTNTTTFNSSQCFEEEDVLTCNAKPQCCFVKQSYSIYTNTGCIDVFSPQNYREFCNNVINNSGYRYYVQSCRCSGVDYANSKYNKISIFLITVIVILFMF